jgi:hypothetical protein
MRGLDEARRAFHEASDEVMAVIHLRPIREVSWVRMERVKGAYSSALHELKIALATARRHGTDLTQHEHLLADMGDELDPDLIYELGKEVKRVKSQFRI